MRRGVLDFWVFDSGKAFDSVEDGVCPGTSRTIEVSVRSDSSRCRASPSESSVLAMGSLSIDVRWCGGEPNVPWRSTAPSRSPVVALSSGSTHGSGREAGSSRPARSPEFGPSPFFSCPATGETSVGTSEGALRSSVPALAPCVDSRLVFTSIDRPSSSRWALDVGRVPRNRRNTNVCIDRTILLSNHIPHTVTDAPPAAWSRQYSFCSLDLSARRSKITKCPSVAAQRSM